ncbi:hypothetical protein EW146_g2157 [Bondarzewia mesenterica]|uniref:Zn(2)-C6 fungal-type domain-containing protein n=1 Tax=Bondarzewia mesenterica TaxID=1095465 RepID=A0A4S4M1J1_9AGAM|nr:hypothetical protein EW146_g2157 [Bondarzewia mesenterica]
MEELPPNAPSSLGVSIFNDSNWKERSRPAEPHDITIPYDTRIPIEAIFVQIEEGPSKLVVARICEECGRRRQFCNRTPSGCDRCRDLGMSCNYNHDGCTRLPGVMKRRVKFRGVTKTKSAKAGVATQRSVKKNRMREERLGVEKHATVETATTVRARPVTRSQVQMVAVISPSNTAVGTGKEPTGKRTGPIRRVQQERTSKRTNPVSCRARSEVKKKGERKSILRLQESSKRNEKALRPHAAAEESVISLSAKAPTHTASKTHSTSGAIWRVPKLPIIPTATMPRIFLDKYPRVWTGSRAELCAAIPGFDKITNGIVWDRCEIPTLLFAGCGVEEKNDNNIGMQANDRWNGCTISFSIVRDISVTQPPFREEFDLGSSNPALASGASTITTPLPPPPMRSCRSISPEIPSTEIAFRLRGGQSDDEPSAQPGPSGPRTETDTKAMDVDAGDKLAVVALLQLQLSSSRTCSPVASATDCLPCNGLISFDSFGADDMEVDEDLDMDVGSMHPPDLHPNSVENGFGGRHGEQSAHMLGEGVGTSTVNQTMNPGSPHSSLKRTDHMQDIVEGRDGGDSGRMLAGEGVAASTGREEIISTMDARPATIPMSAPLFLPFSSYRETLPALSLPLSCPIPASLPQLDATVMSLLDLPTPPPEVAALLGAHSTGLPVSLIFSRDAPLMRWALPEEVGFAWAGLFKIIGVEESGAYLPDVTVKHRRSSIVGETKTLRVTWRMSLQWVCGGEELLSDESAKDFMAWQQITQRPWWEDTQTSAQSASATDFIPVESPSLAHRASSVPPSFTMPPGDTSSIAPNAVFAVSESPAWNFRASSMPPPSHLPLHIQAPAALNESSYDTSISSPSPRHLEYTLGPYLILPLSLFAPFSPLSCTNESFPSAYFCAKCGRINAQRFLRHRACESVRCRTSRREGERDEAGWVSETIDVRNPRLTYVCVYPDNLCVEPGELRLRQDWADGMRVFWYGLSSSSVRSPASTSPPAPPISEITGSLSRLPSPSPSSPSGAANPTSLTSADLLGADAPLVRHVFTANLSKLQREPSEIFEMIQREVKLERAVGGAVFSLTVDFPSSSSSLPIGESGRSGGGVEGLPKNVLKAKGLMEYLARTYGEDSGASGMVRLTVRAWVGALKTRDTFCATDRRVAVLCMGADTAFSFFVPDASSEVVATEGGDDDGGGERSVSVSTSAKGKGKGKMVQATKKKGKSREALRVNMLHGDMMILSGGDFEYTMTRTGMCMLIIGEYMPTQSETLSEAVSA